MNGRFTCIATLLESLPGIGDRLDTCMLDLFPGIFRIVLGLAVVGGGSVVMWPGQPRITRIALPYDLMRLVKPRICWLPTVAVLRVAGSTRLSFRWQTGC